MSMVHLRIIVMMMVRVLAIAELWCCLLCYHQGHVATAAAALSMPLSSSSSTASSSSSSSSSQWLPLPHVKRRQVLTAAGATSGLLATAAAALTSTTTRISPSAAMASDDKNNLSPKIPSSTAISVGANRVLRATGAGTTGGPRSVLSVDSHLAIPVWPSWGGGRVVPVSLGAAWQDPFLLLAHHKHWFDPRDPLRKPFQQIGKVLGLPYVDVEGFAMHPHRGFDIWTYVLDGSDGFRHQDSLAGSEPRVYRGGSAQWMRTGAGVLHEEFWETRPDRRTNIELFQVWVNLGAQQKLDPPAIRYLGKDTITPWIESSSGENNSNNGCWVRDLTATLDTVVDNGSSITTTTVKDFDGQGPARGRPPVKILHVKVDAGAEFQLKSDLNVAVYVREGIARVRNAVAGDDDDDDNSTIEVKALQTATFAHDGDFISIRNANKNQGRNKKEGSSKTALDFLLLAGQPLGESVVQAGPIVMNTAGEINDAYQQLQEGTFLDRDYVLRQQQLRQSRRM